MKDTRRAALLSLIPLLLAALHLVLFPKLGIAEPYGSLLLELGATLLCGVAILLLFLSFRASREKEKTHPRPSRWLWVAAAAALCVALNNLPIRALLLGRARVTAEAPAVLLFAALCLSVALVEETVFRGLLLPALLRRFPKSLGGRLAAILSSSAAFGLVHLANIASGADLLATLLQVGYSFLVGCAAAVLFLLSGRLLLPVAFHALYNFGGLLVPRLGNGALWDTPTVILTAILALVAAVLLSLSLFYGTKGEEKVSKPERN